MKTSEQAQDDAMAQQDVTAREHAAACGTLCRDGGDGCCARCGVCMERCPDCNGIGYHTPECAEMNNEGDAFIVRNAATSILGAIWFATVRTLGS